MEVDDIKSEKAEEPLAESKPGEVMAEVKPEEDSISKGEELKPKMEEEEKKPEVKHKSVRKYFGPLEDIYIMDAMTEVGAFIDQCLFHLQTQFFSGKHWEVPESQL